MTIDRDQESGGQESGGADESYRRGFRDGFDDGREKAGQGDDKG